MNYGTLRKNKEANAVMRVPVAVLMGKGARAEKISKLKHSFYLKSFCGKIKVTLQKVD